MLAVFRRHSALTTGERRLFLAYVAISLFGAILALSAVMRLQHGALLMRALNLYEIWICVAGGAGAAAGLYLVQHRLGLPGLQGWLRALGGMLLLCLTGSVIAGTLVLPLYGTMFGPFTLILILVGSPLLALLWSSTLCGVHLLLVGWRIERDSIFVRQEPDPRFRQGARVSPRP